MAQLFGLARLGRDAEIKKVGNDSTSLANLSLAFNYRSKNERCTQWVDGVLYGKRADSLAQYLLKGSMVAVVLDDVHIESFEKQDGTTATKLVGFITQIDLAGSAAPAQTRAPAPPPPPPARRAPPPAANGFADMDDDIPF